MKVLMEVLPLTSCAMATARVYSWSYSYLGTDFFSGWKFWTAQDPSGGAVKYVDFTEATQAGLINATPARVYLGADMGMVANGVMRRSVRIESRATFNQGLFVASIDHIPTGCSLWPAFWMYGEDGAHIWPAWGEYDIIEGTHRSNHVMTSLHTGAECDQSRFRQNLGVKWMSGPSGAAADNCDVVARDQFHNQGCSQRGPDGSLGGEFNARGGGTYAAEWDPAAKHIRTWFWPRGMEPLDLVQQRPDPDYWGLPYSYFSLDPAVCSAQHFANMRLVFDITFCGDLAGTTFLRDCPEVGAQMSCPDFVRQHPEHLRDAYWSLRLLDVYQRSEFPGARRPPDVPRGGGRPEGRALAPRTALAMLLLVLAALLGVVLMGLLRRRPGGTRHPVFYENCLPDGACESREEDQAAELVLEGPMVETAAWGEDGARHPLSPGHRVLALRDSLASVSRERGGPVEAPAWGDDGMRHPLSPGQRVLALHDPHASLSRERAGLQQGVGGAPGPFEPLGQSHRVVSL